MDTKVPPRVARTAMTCFLKEPCDNEPTQIQIPSGPQALEFPRCNGCFLDPSSRSSNIPYPPTIERFLCIGDNKGAQREQTVEHFLKEEQVHSKLSHYYHFFLNPELYPHASEESKDPRAAYHIYVNDKVRCPCAWDRFAIELCVRLCVQSARAPVARTRMRSYV